MTPEKLLLEKFALPVLEDFKKVEGVLQSSLDSEISLVRTASHYIVENGGKRIRPLITLLCTRLSGYRGDAAPKLAAAMELIHTATLLHDDVIDEAQLRRGKPSANTKWGIPVSVLVGDYFWLRGSQLLVSHGDLKVLQVIVQTIIETTEAEVLEITRHSDLDLDEETYFKIIRGKTALLFSACSRIGAILGGLTEPFEESLRRYGYHFGMAFQLTDDILDSSSELKLTFPFIVALKKASSQEATLLREALIAGRVEPEKLEETIEILTRCGGIKRAAWLAQEEAASAKKALEPFKPCLEKEALLGLANYVITRRE